MTSALYELIPETICNPDTGLRITDSPMQGRWDVALTNGSTVCGSVQLNQGHWLEFKFPVGAAKKPLWHYLKRWDGNVKFSMAPSSKDLFIQTEIPIDGDKESLAMEPVIQACLGIKDAFHFQVGEKMTLPEKRPIKDNHGLEANKIHDMLDQSGWPYTKHADGETVVKLETPFAFYAKVTSYACTILRVSFSFNTSISRDAAAALLLIASGAVKLVRGFNDGEEMGFEVTLLNSNTSSSSLVNALSALSLACLHFGQELKSFEHQRIAEQFLGIRRWAPQLPKKRK